MIITKKPLNGTIVYPNGVKPYEIETRFGYDDKNKYGVVEKPMCGCFWFLWICKIKMLFQRKWYLSDILCWDFILIEIHQKITLKQDSERLWQKFRNCYWVRFLLLQFGFSYESDIKRFVRLLSRVRGSKPIEFVHWLPFMSANE